MTGPQPDGPELRAQLAQLAAMRIAKFRENRAELTDAIVISLRLAAGWSEANARACAAQVAAEALSWTPAQLLDQMSAHLNATNGLAPDAEEGQIAQRQRDVRSRRQAERREDEREQAEEAQREGPVVVRSGRWLTGQTFGPVEWVVPGMFPEGVLLLGGPPKGGKSWLALEVALALASGRQILGALRNGPPRPVLYLALEDSDRRMKQRCAKLGYTEIPELFEYILECRPSRVIAEIAAWLERHHGQRPVVIIDTWGKILGPAARGETIYDRDYRVGGQVKKLAGDHPGAAIWVNHHVRKQAATDFLDTISGTQGVAGAPDTVAVLVRRRHEDHGRLHITGRDVEEDTYQLEGFPCWQLAGGGLPGAAVAARAATERENLGERSAQLLDEIVRAGRMTTKEAALLLGISPDAASVYLGRLAKAEKIAKDGRGIWVPFVPPVGSVGSVGSSQQTQQNKHGIRAREGLPPPPDWERLHDLGNPPPPGDT